MATGGRGGRPPKNAGEKGTTQVRVFDDMGDKLSDLALVHPKSTAQILDPLIRAEVDRLHALYLPKIEEAKAARAEAEAKLRKIQTEAAKLASEPAPPPKPKRGS